MFGPAAYLGCGSLELCSTSLKDKAMGGFRAMIVYQKAFDLAVRIFFLTKKFPKEELYGLSSQVRNSSRSTCANFGEA